MSQPLFKVGERMLTVAQIEAAVNCAAALAVAYRRAELCGSIDWSDVDHTITLAGKVLP